ncbi:MAG TPA: hypothetical protein PLV13_11660, partial [Ilumatobacteraceae bacterium]|nr:hypothetical protein [Ilumatobacteraceae bacterium]
PLASLTLLACSDDDSKSSTTAAPTTEASTNTAGSITIDVTVGTDSGEDRVENIPLGATVTLNITDPAADQTYHVHDYDFEQEVAAGETATFTFTADKAGTFEVESHVTEEVILVLEVA